MLSDEFIASGILEAYALGTATPEEADLAEEMCHRYPQVEAEYQNLASMIEEDAGRYARPAPANSWQAITRSIQPEQRSPRLADLDQDTQQNGREPKPAAWQVPQMPARGLVPNRVAGRQPFARQWASMAMAAALLVSLGVNLYFYRDREELASRLAASERSQEQIARTAGSTESDRQRLHAESMSVRALLYEALKPKSGIIALASQPNAEGVQVAAIYDRIARRVALRASGMPEMDKDQVVQLWVFSKGEPISLGAATEAAEGHLQMADLPEGVGQPEAFALSLETGGLHDSPQGQVLALGKVL